MAAIDPKRGDIFWANIPPTVGSEQHGRRPVLVVSVNAVNSGLPVVVVVPLTAKIQKANRNFRILIPDSQKIQELGTSGCTGESLALTEQVRVMDKFQLDDRRVARLVPAAIGAVEAGLRYVLGIP